MDPSVVIFFILARFFFFAARPHKVGLRVYMYGVITFKLVVEGMRKKNVG